MTFFVSKFNIFNIPWYTEQSRAEQNRTERSFIFVNMAHHSFYKHTNKHKHDQTLILHVSKPMRHYSMYRLYATLRTIKNHPMSDYCPYILRTLPKTFRKLLCRVHWPYNQYAFDRSIQLDNTCLKHAHDYWYMLLEVLLH